jgi:hypothetical protein
MLLSIALEAITANARPARRVSSRRRASDTRARASARELREDIRLPSVDAATDTTPHWFSPKSRSDFSSEGFLEGTTTDETDNVA